MPSSGTGCRATAEVPLQRRYGGPSRAATARLWGRTPGCPKALISLRRIPNHEKEPGDHGVEAAVLEGDRLGLVAVAATGDDLGRPFRGRARVAKKSGPRKHAAATADALGLGVEAAEGHGRVGAEREPDMVAVPNAGRRRRARCDPRGAAPPASSPTSSRSRPPAAVRGRRPPSGPTPAADGPDVEPDAHPARRSHRRGGAAARGSRR